MKLPPWFVWLLAAVAVVAFVKWSDSRDDFSRVDDSRESCYGSAGPNDC
jgi:hypothetical protein